MKRNSELLLQMMLAIEGTKPTAFVDFAALKTDRKEVREHILLLQDADYVRTTDPEGNVSMLDGKCAVRLTWAGHEYLEKDRPAGSIYENRGVRDLG